MHLCTFVHFRHTCAIVDVDVFLLRTEVTVVYFKLNPSLMVSLHNSESSNPNKKNRSRQGKEALVSILLVSLTLSRYTITNIQLVHTTQAGTTTKISDYDMFVSLMLCLFSYDDRDDSENS